MRTVKSDLQGYPQVFDIHATTLTRAGLVATFTATKPHRLTTGNRISVRGADQQAFNVTSKVVTVSSATVFTYELEQDPGANAVVTNVVANRNIPANEYNPWLTANNKTGRLQVEPMGAAMGEFGFDLIADTTNRTTVSYGVLLPLTDVVVASMTSSGQQNGTSWATRTLKAGVLYHVPIVTQLQLTSGELIAYYWQPLN